MSTQLLDSKTCRNPAVSVNWPKISHHTDFIIQAPKRGFIGTGAEIVRRETPLGLYKGLGAVLTGIVPKMAIRFTSYEWYKQLLAAEDGTVSSRSTFLGKYS